VSFGFEILDSAGNLELDTTSIGLQVVHEVTLTAASTNVTWVSEHSPFYFVYFSMHSSGHMQTLMWTDVTPAGAPVNSNTYTFTVNYGKTLGNVRLVVVGGDANSVTDAGSTAVGGLR
jgi:hypothetical protein